MGKLNVKFHTNDEYEYISELRRISLDERREDSILSGNGFFIRNVQSTLKKNLKDPNSIYSIKFGQTLSDINPFANKYRCECGALNQRIYAGVKCPICNKRVRYMDDNFGYFGWITLDDPYYIIHPNLYKSLQNFLGKSGSKDYVLDNILNYQEEKDINGYRAEITDPKILNKLKTEPFYGIGMMEFKERIVEILDYYRKKRKKDDYYFDLMNNLDKIFTQSIPVYTTILRPFTVDDKKFHFEGTNKYFNMMSKLAFSINNNTFKYNKKRKMKNQLLYDLTNKYNELYKELENIICGKKGALRSIFGGRYAFTSRDVIIPNSKLKIDEVIMPYKAMVVLLKQTIINILQKTYYISHSQAVNICERAQRVKDERVEQIILNIIKDQGRGVPILINRNPTIQYGGILQMYVVGLTDSYTLQVPLQILPLISGDFDGDVLNVLYMINAEFRKAAIEIFNPRNAMCISRNDGKLNNAINHTKDTLINANALINICRPYYSREQLERIARLKNKYGLK